MEKDIIYTAFKNLEKTANIVFKFDFKEDHPNYDGTAIIESFPGTPSFKIEVKRNLTLSRFPGIKNDNNLKDRILVSDYIPKAMKEFLRSKKLSYIDIAGNAYIESGSILLLIEKNKNGRTAFQANKQGFSKAGLKVIYQLLIDGEMVNNPYRKIGKISKVSIDTVSKVFKELIKQRYIIQLEDKEYKIVEREKLISEWVTLFNKTLRPKLKQKRYKIMNNFDGVYNNCPIDSLGGELAGELLSEYLIAESAIIYSDLSFLDGMKKYKLRPADNGNITLVEKFWYTTGDTSRKNALVHPLLIYADLLNDPTPRNIETANIIYRQHVKATI